MLDFATIEKAIRPNFDSVVNLGNNVLRAERTHRDRPYLVAYLDLADDVVGRASRLTKFQEQLVGPTFFSTDSDLRWNSYVYFLAGPNSQSNPKFEEAKAQIESDRHFARKYVVSEQDLLLRIGRHVSGGVPTTSIPEDVDAEWAAILKKEGLGVLLEQRHRTKVLPLIANGEAFKIQPVLHAEVDQTNLQDDALQSGYLTSISIKDFRNALNGKSFQFGDVNLISGPNGVGKTSLLEAIEAVYCGRVQRDPEATISGIQAEVRTPGGGQDVVMASLPVPVLKARQLKWYGRAEFQSTALSQAFGRFNFLDADAAFRLSYDTSRADIDDDLSRLLIGAEAAKLWNYLVRLEEDLREATREASEKVRLHNERWDLLVEELKRLEATPSESTVLAESYVAVLKKIGPAWKVDTNQFPNPERSRLQSLSELLSRVLGLVNTTPVTLAILKVRRKALKDAFTALQRLSGDYSTLTSTLTEVARQRGDLQRQISLLYMWGRYLDARLPELISELKQIRKRIAQLQSSIGEIAKDMPPIPDAYAGLSVDRALISAKQDLALRIEAERLASAKLSGAIQLGESL